MRNYIILALAFILSLGSAAAQKSLTFRGLVVDDQAQPLFGATIRWAETQITAVSGEDGWFELPRIDTLEGHQLEINYIGYELVYVEILPEEDHLRLQVEASAKLDLVEVISTERGVFHSTIQPIAVEEISSCELKRAACCSLAESFENNATVNVGASDAVTGAKEIEMLGLRGTYTQMLIENRPSYNRLDRPYGMEYIPGTWVESIQVAKGSTTIRNGSQSLAGMINTELLKPHKADPLFLNLYLGHMGRVELNAHLNHKLNKNWAAGVLFHSNYLQRPDDHNHDGFPDLTLKNQYNALGRLVHDSRDWYADFSVQGILDRRNGSQLATAHHIPAQGLYRITTDVERLEAFGKLGYKRPNNRDRSAALVYSLLHHDHRSIFGNRAYNALQRTAYVQGLYQMRLSEGEGHNLSVQGSYQHDQLTEQFSDIGWNRLEQTAGAGAEYHFKQKWDNGQSMDLLLGLRGDYIRMPDQAGFYPVPRLSFRYGYRDGGALRLSAGRGVRLPSLLMDNLRYMPSARNFVFNQVIRPETAWNMGFNVNQNTKLRGREGQINLDVYHTEFQNQLIADADHNLSDLYLFNLRGRSFASSILLSYTQDIAKGLELRLAYKYNEVQADFHGRMQWQFFAPRHRGLMALHYVTPNGRWQFNSSAQLTGPQRLPIVLGDRSGEALPAYREANLAPTFVTLHGQVTYYHSKAWEFYLGAENLGNYRQAQPILGFQDPYSPNFDAASVYGPVMGIMGYAGIRYTLAKKDKGHAHGEVESHHGHKHKIVEIQTSAQCGMCKASIEDKLKAQPGVVRAVLDLRSKKAQVEYESGQTSPEAIRQAISALGYDADEILGDAKAYEQLPACCKKGGHD